MSPKKFIDDLQAAKDVRQVNQVLRNYLENLGFTHFSFTYYAYHPNSPSKIKYDYCSESFKVWHKHYLNESYEDIDTTLLEVYNTALPTFWDLQQQLKEARTERERQMRLDSIAFGSEKGISIPIHGPNDDFAILLLVQMKGQNCLDNWQALESEFLAFAYYYYNRLQHLLLIEQPGVTQYQLTEREMQCLLLIAKRYTVGQIAKTLKITERTVNFHIQKINKKLKTANKYQSVAKALEKQLINL